MQLAGINKLGVTRDKIKRSSPRDVSRLIDSSGIEVVYLTHRSMFSLDDPSLWSSQLEDVKQTLEIAAEFGATIVYGTTGPGGQLSWEESIVQLEALVKPAVDYGKSLGVQLCFETTNPQFADIDVLHTFANTREVTAKLGMGICFDIHASWTERELEQNVAESISAIRLVQVSDYVAGTRTLDRGIPGDGIIPLERILRWVLGAGYSGPIDLELFGEQGVDKVEAIKRGCDYLSALLDSIGA